jgi:hypothetical protein
MESTKSKCRVPVKAGEDKVFWQQHISAWSVSGTSKIDYCQMHQLDYARFIYWSSKQTSPHPSAPLIAVRLSSQQEQEPLSSDTPLCTLQCKNGNSLHMYDMQVLPLVLDKLV